MTPYQTKESYTCPINGPHAYADAKLLCDLIKAVLRALGTPVAMKTPTSNVRAGKQMIEATNAWLEKLGVDPLVSDVDLLETRFDIAACLRDGLSDLTGPAVHYLLDNDMDNPYKETSDMLVRFYDSERPDYEGIWRKENE
jgi:hypothetical protein